MLTIGSTVVGATVPCKMLIARTGCRAPVSTDPNDPANQPAHGSDVFIGGIPKELTDEQLREFASPAGEVWQSGPVGSVSS